MSSSILFPANQYMISSKSPEQIEKLMLPEFDSMANQCLFILTKGCSVQYQFVYRNFYRCLNDQLLSQICQIIPETDSENHLIILQSFDKLLASYLEEESERKYSDDMFTNKNIDEFVVDQIKVDQSFAIGFQHLETIFNTLIQCLNNWTSAAIEQIVPLIQKVIQLAKGESPILVKKLQKVILDMGKPTNPIISRVNAARLMSIYPRYTHGNLRGQMIEILKKVHCDNEVEARKAWVKEIFPKMLANCTSQFAQLHLQQKVYESVYDDNEDIGILALQVIFKNATKFSIEEQSSRIVKLFLDSLTSKNDRIAIMTTKLMGQIYEKLQFIILRSQQNTIKFWKNLVEIAQSRNQAILNNLIYNLPGILIISQPNVNVQPICDIYLELFYDDLANKTLLASFLHQMYMTFPRKSQQFKEVVYDIITQIVEDLDPTQDLFHISDAILENLESIRHMFVTKILKQNVSKQGEVALINKANYLGALNSMPITHNNRSLPAFQNAIVPQKNYSSVSPQSFFWEDKFIDLLIKYFGIIFVKQNTISLKIFYKALLPCCQLIPPESVEQVFLPKIYSAIRNKTPHLECIMPILVAFLTKDIYNSVIVNNYISKINVELSKSSKSFQRESAMLFFYYASFQFSIDTFQEFKLGEKFLHLHQDKNFKNKTTFIRCLKRMVYFFTRQEKIQYMIVVNKFLKDSDPEIVKIMEQTKIIENETIKHEILEKSKQIRQREKQKTANYGRRVSSNIRKDKKEPKKEDILKKRIETKSKSKIVIKEIPKKKSGILSKMQLRKNS